MRTQEVKLTITAVFRDDEVLGTAVADIVAEEENLADAVAVLLQELDQVEEYGGEICDVSYYVEGSDDI